MHTESTPIGGQVRAFRSGRCSQLCQRSYDETTGVDDGYSNHGRRGKRDWQIKGK